MIGRRGADLAVALDVVTERLRRRLREDEGVSYHVGSSSATWTPDVAHLTLVADALPEHLPQVCDGLGTELNRFALLGPADEELARCRDEHRQALARPHAAAARAYRRAVDLLLGIDAHGAPPEHELDAVTSAGVAAAIGGAMRTALWSIPRGMSLKDRRVVHLDRSSVPFDDAATFQRSAGSGNEATGPRLQVGPSGVGLVFARDEAVVIRYGEVEAMQIWTDDARTVWARNGVRLFVHPADWRDGAIAVRTIDRHVDPVCCVPMRRDSAPRR
jgi:hypothetical protein